MTMLSSWRFAYLYITLQINLVSNVKHAALGGDTVVLSESDAINESFYDLFNQRFHCIVDEKYVRVFLLMPLCCILCASVWGTSTTWGGGRSS